MQASTDSPESRYRSTPTVQYEIWSGHRSRRFNPPLSIILKYHISQSLTNRHEVPLSWCPRSSSSSHPLILSSASPPTPVSRLLAFLRYYELTSLQHSVRQSGLVYSATSEDPVVSTLVEAYSLRLYPSPCRLFQD